ncbi:sensor domain-containing diguanylate cyclase [Yersinia hibernica]|uniref:diguanylate cyclase n=1 Tax=Yersinia enterocolitica LC20 TaxID=1443113 RepID=A0A7U4JZT1_YEREN|nr:sensor domain-containing diguanylate cyclase [Yersinia hibernica]AHM71815.2 diguanylate cyclase [Yersinia hibernica]OVZ86950.1 diguanylate cyclase [Yersinia kristensenii]
MLSTKIFRLDLGRLILILAVMSAFVTLANSFYASYRVQRQLLIDNTLEANRVYATKLASSTEIFLLSAQKQLHYSSVIAAKNFDDQAALQAETARLKYQTDSFNSVVVTDTHGIVRATSPDSLQLLGHSLTSPGSVEALKLRRPLISKPYMSAANNLVINISTPIITPDGHYRGYIGGTIYLRKQSILNELLGEHYYRDGSYIVVLDSDRRILYHRDVNRIGEILEPKPITEASKKSDNGSLIVTNTSGEPMLAGYSMVDPAGWEIVTLRPESSTLKPLEGLMLKGLGHIAPLALLTLLGVWLLSRMIARPLWLLAGSANDMDKPDIANSIKEIPSWYFESTQLKRALLIGISLLQKKIGKLRFEAQTDPMTGLYNRRGLATTLEPISQFEQHFSVIALDIDHFKVINDSYGHDVGDEVIKQLAVQIRESSRDTDILCRSGGEEFLMLLPGTSPDVAIQVANRLRQNVEMMVMPGIRPITISLGVAYWSGEDKPEDALKRADEALYHAKQRGRNRVETS